MDKTLGTINSITTFVAAVQSLVKTKRRLYRGQPVDKPLLPRFAREARDHHFSDPLRAERDLLDSFEALSVPYLGGERPRNAFELLAIAQHHGVPTRLLDWTGNPLFALWFAIGNEQTAADAVVWALDVQDDHQIPRDEALGDPFSLKRTRVFRPSHVTRRIVAQDGWFTAHWYIERQNKFVALDSQARFKSHLRKFTIPLRYQSNMREDLRRLGISEVVLFPELPVVSKQLVKDFFAALAERSDG